MCYCFFCFFFQFRNSFLYLNAIDFDCDMSCRVSLWWIIKELLLLVLLPSS